MYSCYYFWYVLDSTWCYIKKNVKVKVRSPDWDTDIVAGVLQGDKLSPYLFIICLDYVLRTSIDIMKDNGYMLARERSWQNNYGQTITDVNYADDIAFLANT